MKTRTAWMVGGVMALALMGCSGNGSATTPRQPLGGEMQPVSADGSGRQDAAGGSGTPSGPGSHAAGSGTK